MLDPSPTKVAVVQLKRAIVTRIGMRINIILLFVLALFFSPNRSHAEEFVYQVFYKNSPVGRCLISVELKDQRKLVTYRMNIDVRILFVSFYKLDSEQIAVYDDKNQLIKARTIADIDGTSHLVELNSSGEFFSVVHNNKPKQIRKSEIISTTLDPVFSVPSSGNWLDLTNAKVIPYEVSISADEISLKRPDGRDRLFPDANGFLRRIESSDDNRRGILSMERLVTPNLGRYSLPPLLKIDPEILLR